MKKTHCLAILALLCALGLATPTVVSALLTSGASAASETPVSEDSGLSTEVGTSVQLIAAVENAGISKIKLLGDIEVSFEDENIIGLYIDRDVTIDLNGYTLSMARSGARIFNVQAGASLILTGSTGSRVLATGEGGIPIRVYGNESAGGDKTQLTVDKNVILEVEDSKSTSYGVIVSPNAKNTAYDVEIIVHGQIRAYSGLYVNGKIQHTNNMPKILLSSTAEVVANAEGGAAIYAAGYATWGINGAKLSGAIGIGTKAGKFSLSNATIATTGAYVNNVATDNNGMNDAGAVFQIEENNAYAKGVDITVASGNYSSSESVVFYQYPQVAQGKARSTGEAPQIQILGGSFTANNAEHGAIFEGIDAERVTLTGGTFAAPHGQDDVIAIAAKSGYELVSNPDGSLSQKPTSGGSSSKPADDPEDEDPETTPEQKPSNPDAGVAGTMGDYATNTSVMTAALVGILLVGGCWALYGIHRARSARLAEAKRAASRKTTAKKSTAVKKTAKKSTKSTAARKTATTRRKK